MCLSHCIKKRVKGGGGIANQWGILFYCSYSATDSQPTRVNYTFMIITPYMTNISQIWQKKMEVHLFGKKVHLKKYVRHCIFEILLVKSTDYMPSIIHHMALLLSLCRGLNSLQVSRYVTFIMFYSGKCVRHCISLFLRVKKKPLVFWF